MRRAFLSSLLLLAAGCSTEIGDDCSSNAECGQGRICDRASRGGYCTVSPRAPGTCPENSTCVEFANEETFCMALCDGSEDCRGGYQCVDRENGANYCRQKPDDA